MWALRLTLMLAISYGCQGQNAYYDIGTQIQNNGVLTVGEASTDRRICFDGSNVYYTIGSQIFQDGVTGVIIDTGGPTIYSLSCHCNIIVYSFIDSGSTFVNYYDTSGREIGIGFDLGAVGGVAVELSPSHGLVIVGSQRIWIYDQAPLTTAGESFTYLTVDSVTSLANFPRCIATYETGTGDRVVFVSFATNNNVQVITIPSGTASESAVSVTDRRVRKDGFVARVSCLDVNQGLDEIYFLVVQDSQPTDWSLDSYPIADWLTINGPESDKTVLQSGTTNGQVGSNVNGLVICGTDCQVPCDLVSCECPTTAPRCGFCIGDVTTCQCQNSGQTGCFYNDPTLAALCLVPDPLFDSYCIVDLPLAQRRKGGPIRVVGAAAASASISVSRLAQTGRWNIFTLPISTFYSGNTASVYWDGIEAAVPSLGRGRRFGVYVADVSPTDPGINPESIPCIATENSGFYNPYYTYTGSLGDPVTLLATMSPSLQVFIPRVRWLFTGFNPITGVPQPSDPIPGCSGSLTCSVSSLVAEDEGVYEAYRLNRRKRTWHPLFYLFVRDCEDGMFGPSCTSTCPACVHGVCEETTGLCTCKAGWSGTLCDTVCGAGEIGQSCGYGCSDIFSGRTDCSGLSFCVPGKVGCHCYSGFEAPDCMDPCTTGFCGPSCDTPCPGGGTCDARTCL